MSLNPTTKLYGYFKSRRANGWRFAKLWEIHGPHITAAVRYLEKDGSCDGFFVDQTCPLSDVVAKHNLIPATKQDRAKALLLGFK